MLMETWIKEHGKLLIWQLQKPLLFRYSHEQGLAGRKLTVEELFHPSTLELAEA